MKETVNQNEIEGCTFKPNLQSFAQSVKNASIKTNPFQAKYDLINFLFDENKC